MALIITSDPGGYEVLNTTTGQTYQFATYAQAAEFVNANGGRASAPDVPIGSNVQYVSTAERSYTILDNNTTASGTYIGNQLFVPGQQLSKQQMAAVQLALATENQVDPAVLAQYNSQGGQAALAVARANGVDPNAPLTPEQQEIVNASARPVNTGAQTPEEAAAAVAAGDIQRSPTVPGDYQTQYDELTGQYIVVEANTGDVVASGLTEQEATLFAQDQAIADEGVSITGAPDGGLVEFTQEGEIVRQPTEVSETALYGTPYDDNGILNPGWELDGNGDPYYKGYSQGKLWINPNTAESAEASRVEAFRNQARQQQTIAQQRKQINNGDWRVRLRLAPQANYLYNAPAPGILQPLKVTDGIIFPYTPQIDTAYKVNYSPYDLTHSNYRGYFYQNSFVDGINIRAQFTAQDTNEANYLLAVITFLKAATKMFYGQDAERGSPPPLVYLSGLGEYQFNEHPCLIQQFNYNLPDGVDYIRAGSALQSGLNLVNQRDRQSVATSGIVGIATRLAAAFLTKGAIPSPLPPPSLGTNRPTYVPTKMEISLNLLPVQSRQQVSKQFSVKSFANGDLIKGGFW